LEEQVTEQRSQAHVVVLVENRLSVSSLSDRTAGHFKQTYCPMLKQRETDGILFNVELVDDYKPISFSMSNTFKVECHRL
jgi:hypothetical protein